MFRRVSRAATSELPKTAGVLALACVITFAGGCIQTDGSSGNSGGTAGAGGSGASGGSGGTGASGGSGASGGNAGSGATGGSAGNAGSAGTTASGGSSGSSSTDPLDALRDACVKRINDFRATEGKPPYARWTDGEACADEQAGNDANGGGPHGNFGMCGEFAQNTCPGWGSYDDVIQNCLQAMWDEGPGEPFSEHGHYINMSSDNYSKVACGFYKMADGSIWASQNFK
ncbi:MAG: hypothetical protein R3B07_19805 [Polyangiaceae bacterium]